MKAMKILRPMLIAAMSLLALSSTAFAGPPIEYSGPMAKKHAGEFIFSTKPIALKAATEDGFTKSFSLKDKIYIRFWGKETAGNVNPRCRRETRISYKVSVNDGKTQYLGVVRVGKGVSALSPTDDAKRPLTIKTTFGDKTQKNWKFIREWNGTVIPRLNVGDNKVKMWATVDCGSGDKTDPTIAETEVTIKVAKGDGAKYAKKFGPHPPKSKLKGGKKLIPKVVTMLTNKWDNEIVIGGVFTTDWWVKHHKYHGRAMYRSAEVGMVMRLKKETNPNVCRLFFISVKQVSMNGRKKFAKGVQWNGVGGNEPVHCGIVKQVKGK